MGYDLTKYPMIESMYNDPVAFFKEMRKDPRMATYMGYFDENILSKEIAPDKSNDYTQKKYHSNDPFPSQHGDVNAEACTPEFVFHHV